MKITHSILSLRVLSVCIGMHAAWAAMGADSPSGGARAPLDCTLLRTVHLPHTTIDVAQQVPAGTFKLPTGSEFREYPADFAKLPAFCRVAGSLHPSADSEIRFELWLPLKGWNGRFMQTGNGGAAGGIIYESLAEPLSRGYAVANTDTGHQGGEGDFSWALGHPQRVIDFDYRAVHELTVAGKTIS